MIKLSPIRSITRARKLVHRSSRRSRSQRGMALLTTLLLLILVSLLGLTMAVTTNSDMMINGYYGSYRGSFNAADSGLSIARAALVNQLTTTCTPPACTPTPSTINLTSCVGWGTGAATGCTSPPLNGASAASAALTNLTSTYGTFTSLNAGQAANSWPGKFMIPSTVNGCTTSVTLASATPSVPSGTMFTVYTYAFNYELCAVGRGQALQQVATKEDGSVTVTVTANSTTGGSGPGSFSAFGGFIDNFPQCINPLVYGTMSGRFFTNGQWNFGTGGSYIFTGPVGQQSKTADYIFSGGGHGAPSCGGVSGCDCVAASSDTYSGQTIKPTFQQGFLLGQKAVPLPTDDYSQKWAVLDGLGYGESPANPGNAQFNAYLKNINGTSYSSSGASSGVYLPYCTGGAGCTSPFTVNGGGIYVEGNASIQLSLNTDGSGNPTQIYAIKNNGVTTTITTNINANTTKVVSGGTTLNLTGVPKNLTGTGVQPAATVLYVDGTITGLKGPGQGTASINDYSMITVVANGDIDVTGDLIYKTEPVTLNNSDALVPGADHNQVLGLFTANGNIVLSSSYGNQNLEVDASMAAINATCPGGSSSCGFATSGSINTWTVVGGRIESNAHSVSMSAANTYFDQRFTSRTDGFAPPFFPSTTLPATGAVTATTPTVSPPTTQRLTWVTWPQ